MGEELTRISFMEAPSFGIAGNAAAETAACDHIPVDDLDFSFTSLGLTEATADENFSDSRILPIYPVFNRNLVSELDLQSGSASSYSSMSSEAENLQDLRATASYCVWAPRPFPQSPERWRKSGRRSRLWDLVFGRNRSDGMEKLVAYPAQEKKKMEKMRVPFPVVGRRSAAGEAGEKGKKGKGKGGAEKGMDIVTAYRIFYGKNHAGARRSFLPYRHVLHCKTFKW